MSTLPFTLLMIGIILSGRFIGVVLHLISKKQRENVIAAVNGYVKNLIYHLKMK